jgi:hypothetical protein
MKKLIIILVAFAALTGTAAAARTSSTMTETQAEAYVARNVIYRHTKVIADLKAWVDTACAGVTDPRTADPQVWQQCSSARSQYNNARRPYRAQRVACRAASPSRDSYHFTRFRCVALFVRSDFFGDPEIAGWGRGTLTVTGWNRAVWRWLP